MFGDGLHEYCDMNNVMFNGVCNVELPFPLEKTATVSSIMQCNDVRKLVWTKFRCIEFPKRCVTVSLYQ